MFPPEATAMQFIEWRLAAARNVMTLAAREQRVTLALQAEYISAKEEYERAVKECGR